MIAIVLKQKRSDSIEDIHKRLHERNEIIDKLVHDQELRQFSGILNPVCYSNTEIETLNKLLMNID